MESSTSHQLTSEFSVIETEREFLEKKQQKGLPLTSGLTLRATLIGLAACCLLAFLDISSQSIAMPFTGRLTSDGFGNGALFLVFGLIVVVGLLKRMGLIRSGLKSKELLVVFSMLIITSGIPTLCFYLLPTLAGLAHLSSDSHSVGRLVAPLLPKGLVIGDQALSNGFFEGLEPGEGVPYAAWVGPLAAWGVLFGAFYVTAMALMVIVRKRWMEQERLPFPMAQLPLSLIEGTAGERPLLRNGVFWFGFAVPALVGLNGILRSFLPSIPAINLLTYASFYRNSITLVFYTNFLVLGISYLVPLEILVSIFLFNMLGHLQIFLINIAGIPILDSHPLPPGAYYSNLNLQSIGALVVMVGFGLYEARHHLRDVFRKAFGSAPEVDDEDEFLYYRTAVLGSITGIAFICCWLLMTGISWWVVPIFVVLMLVTFLGVTRVLAEAGVVLIAPLSPMQILFKSAGSRILGGSTMTGFLLGHSWAYPTRAHVMAGGSTAIRLEHRNGQRTRPLFYVFFLALLVAGVTAAATMLHYGYGTGAYGQYGPTGHSITMQKILNFYGSIIGDLSQQGPRRPRETGGYLNAFSSSGDSEGQPIYVFWSGVGAAVMGLLIFARRRFFWWPFAPVGYVIGNLTQTWVWWINVLVAWLVKRNLLKYGGPTLHGKARSFFLGLIMGEAVIASVGEVLHLLVYLF